MANTWVTDMQHMMGLADSSSNATDRKDRMGDCLGRIVSAASAWYVGQPLESMVRCPGGSNKPCSAYLYIEREADDSIVWLCRSCGENGVIRGWKHTPWDLSEPESPGEFLAMISAATYEVVAKLSGLPRLAQRVVARAAAEREEVVLVGTLGELESVILAVKAALSRASGRRKALLRQALKIHMRDSVVQRSFPDGPTRTSSPKISETLLYFAEPIIRMLGPNPPLSAMKGALDVAVTVWNAMVIQEWGRGDHYLPRARQSIAEGMPQFIPIFDSLIERKARFFASDLRAVGNYEVYRASDGEIRLKADARAPKSPSIAN